LSATHGNRGSFASIPIFLKEDQVDDVDVSDEPPAGLVSEDGAGVSAGFEAVVGAAFVVEVDDPFLRLSVT